MPVWFSSLLLAHSHRRSTLSEASPSNSTALGRDGAVPSGYTVVSGGSLPLLERSRGLLLTTENQNTSALTSEALKMAS